MFLLGVSAALLVARFPAGLRAGGGFFGAPHLDQAADRSVRHVLGN